MSFSQVLKNILDAADVLVNGVQKPVEKTVTCSIEGFRRLSLGMKLIVLTSVALLILLTLYFGYGFFVSFFSDNVTSTLS